MPSQLHEALLLLFKNRPALAPELLQLALDVALPRFTEVRLEAAELTDIQPAEYRADLVVLLLDGKPVLGIVLEVQLGRDAHKRFAWPVYVAGLRARIKCPVCLLVVCADDAIARWCARPIDLGPGSALHPYVVGPAGVPVVTDAEVAKADPELAVLSAMAHGTDADPEKALQIALVALAASVGLDAQRSLLYADLVAASLGEAARKALIDMDPAKYEFQSEWAKRFLNEGRAEGRADLVVKLLTLRFGPLSDEVTATIRSASVEQLDLWAERVLSAQSLDDVLRD